MKAFLFLAAVLPALAAHAATEAPAIKAQAKLAPTAGNTASGTVSFVHHADKLYVKARIEGLSPGLHGFHIHEKGDCSAADGSSAGGHFNPAGVQHGHPERSEHHGGDFGNLTADEQGVAVLDMQVPASQIGLTAGAANNVRGRGMIVHASPDDYATQPTGNSGKRLACGVIEQQEG